MLFKKLKSKIIFDFEIMIIIWHQYTNVYKLELEKFY